MGTTQNWCPCTLFHVLPGLPWAAPPGRVRGQPGSCGTGGGHRKGLTVGTGCSEPGNSSALTGNQKTVTCLAKQSEFWVSKLRVRHGKARPGKAGQGKARQGKATPCTARQGKAGQGQARQGKERKGKARQGKAGQGKARHGTARHSKA